MFRARLRARLCRGKEEFQRAPTFVRQFGGYTHILLLFLSSTHSCPLFHPLLSEISKALHGRLAGRFKPPLAGRCNDFAPSRQKNCHRQKQPSRPGPRKKHKNTAPSRPVEKKKKSHPVPPRKKKTTVPSRLGKNKQTPRPASNKKNPRPVPP